MELNTLLQYLLPAIWLQPLVKPMTRVIVGLVAVPMFRTLLRPVQRTKEFGDELQKDLEQWFRGSILLLMATANMEHIFFGWVPPNMQDEWWLVAMRLLLAIGVVEGMPDQALFAIIHPGPAKPNIDLRRILVSVIGYLPELVRGLICQHINRASPVFAIMTVFLPGQIGWVFYGLAITQYLVIGLVSSRDRAIDVLSEFDTAVAAKRKELLEELADRSLIADEPPGSSG